MKQGTLPFVIVSYEQIIDIYEMNARFVSAPGFFLLTPHLLRFAVCKRRKRDL